MLKAKKYLILKVNRISSSILLFLGALAQADTGGRINAGEGTKLTYFYMYIGAFRHYVITSLCVCGPVRVPASQNPITRRIAL